MSKEDLEERLGFLGLGEVDRRLLAELAPLLERHADRFVAAFYRHLLSFDATRRLLVEPEVKDRLLGKQKNYLRSLADAAFDENYVAERLRIGDAHERVGLEPRWYLGAYSLYFSLLLPIICESHRDDPTRIEHTVSALMKVLMLDAQLAVEAYIRRREAELDYLNRELASAGRAIAREYEEQEETLRETTQRARAAEELASVATLVAGLAHEVGTPMGVIRGHAEALESAVEGERAQWRLRTIRDQIDRIASIIQALLNIARPREAVRAPVDLAKVVETTLAFVSEKLRKRGIEGVRKGTIGTVVMGDSEKLQQLFLNLFLNAADAMPEGGRLEVTLASLGTGHVEIRVTDTGIGIPPDALARIFEPFFTSKAPGRGSGLGLVVAQGIVLDHRGEIEVASRVGEGTEFRIVLPAGEDESQASESGSGSRA